MAEVLEAAACRGKGAITPASDSYASSRRATLSGKTQDGGIQQQSQYRNMEQGLGGAASESKPVEAVHAAGRYDFLFGSSSSPITPSRTPDIVVSDEYWLTSYDHCSPDPPCDDAVASALTS